MCTLGVEDSVRDAGYAPESSLAGGVSSARGEHTFYSQGSFDHDSVAYGASLGKQITGACAAMLAHDGLLDAESPIGEWLTELPSWSMRVRVRHLIHHTAGLPDVWPRMQDLGESNWTSSGVLAALVETPDLDGKPGTCYVYSNVGYICLAFIIERIAGESFGELVRTRIFDPLGMRMSTLWSGPAPSPPDARLAAEQHQPAALSLGDGGLWTTASDLLRWNDALLADELGVSATMHAPGALDDGTPLDYAWGVRVFKESGQTVHSHGGDWGEATAKLVRLPDLGASFALLASGSVQKMSTLSDLLREGLIGRSLGSISSIGPA